MANSRTVFLSHYNTYPLLMDQDICSEHQHGVNSSTASQAITIDHRSCRPLSSQESIAVGIESPSISPVSVSGQAHIDNPAVYSVGRSSSSSSHLQLLPRPSFLRSSSSMQQHRESSRFGASQRSNSLNSGMWISFEVLITVSQIVASTIVLVLSWNEKPEAPLGLWVIGYTAGCVVMLPLLYWRYKQRRARQQEDDVASVSAASVSRSSTSPHVLQTVSQQNTQADDLETSLSISGEPETANHGNSRFAKHVERFKMALDCFFAVWFVIGNIWTFGGRSSAEEAPNLYRLCIVFLTFSSISYAMPLVVCATVCCCLPCIVTILSYREEHGHAKGALPDVIAALPIYKFQKRNSNKECKYEKDSDSESCDEGGIFAPGTEKERIVSGEDSVCCICLGKYKDGVDLKELQCAHFFHVECVEKWLKINATCPLCKHEVIALNVDEQTG